jgi:hypothetical protein
MIVVAAKGQIVCGKYSDYRGRRLQEQTLEKCIQPVSPAAGREYQTTI